MINLLPPKEKGILVSEERLKITLILGILFLVFLSFLGLILFSFKAFLLNQMSSEKEKLLLKQKRIETSEIQALREKTSFFNSRFLELNSFFENRIFLTDIFKGIDQLLPEGTYLTSFFYQKDRKEIYLSGFAPTREVLFKLKKNFESKEMIKDLSFPLSNWVEPEDIEFHLRFKVDI